MGGKTYRLRDSGWGLVNKKTGEIADVDITIHRGGGRFMKVWQDTGWQYRLKELQGRSLLVLYHLMATANWQNQVPETSETAQALALKQVNVSRAYSELIKAGFLYKRDGIYHLSPLFCWKGSDKQLGQAIEELLATPVKALRETTNPSNLSLREGCRTQGGQG